MTLIACATVAIAVVLIALYLKTQQREIAALLVIAGTLLLFLVGLKNTAQAIGVIFELAKDSSYSAEVETMLKALGLAAVSQITADVCREAGEATIAAQVEFVGRLEIVALSLPLVVQLFSLVQAFLI